MEEPDTHHGLKIDGLLHPNIMLIPKCKRKVPPPSIPKEDFSHPLGG